MQSESGEIGRSRQRVRNFTEVSFPWSRSSWSKEKVKMSHRLFLSKFTLAGKALVIDPLSPRNNYCLLVCFHLVSWETGLATIRLEVGGQKYGRTEMWAAPYFQVGSYQLLLGSQGICLSLSLLVVLGSSSGSWECDIFCALFEDPSDVHWVIQYCQEYVVCSVWILTRYSKEGFFFFK